MRQLVLYIHGKGGNAMEADHYKTLCGRFRPDEGAVAGYGNRIRAKYTAKWGVQIAGMLFQTRSRQRGRLIMLKYFNRIKQVPCFHCMKQ